MLGLIYGPFPEKRSGHPHGGENGGELDTKPGNEAPTKTPMASFVSICPKADHGQANAAAM